MSHIFWLRLEKQQSELLQRFRTLQDASRRLGASVTFLLGKRCRATVYLVRCCREESWNNSSLAPLSIRRVTNDCPGPVGNVLKSVAHQSILEFDISSIRSFLKREKITQCNAFSLCVASFFITLFICCKSYLMNRSQNAKQRSPVHTNTPNGCRELRSHPFPPREPQLSLCYT